MQTSVLKFDAMWDFQTKQWAITIYFFLGSLNSGGSRPYENNKQSEGLYIFFNFINSDSKNNRAKP